MSRSTRRPDKDVNPYGVNTSSLSKSHGPLMTRRSALKAMLGITAITAGLLGDPLRPFAAEASKETQDALASAQQQYEDAQNKLNEISDQYVKLNEQLNDTVSQIEQIQGQINDTQSQIDDKQDEIDKKQAEIDDKQAELDDKQDQLGARISESYKTGSANLLSVFLNSTSFEQLTNNLTYMGKINASDEQLIGDVKDAKAELEQAKSDLEDAKSQLEDAKSQLEDQKAQLEQLKGEQQDQLAAVQAKQDEATALVDSLSQDVKDLVAKRDAEILAAAEEERRQKEAAEAAARAAQQAAQSGGGSGGAGVTGSLSGASASTKGSAIVSACSRVGSPGAGLCAMWVSQVYSAAGLGYPGGNANNMYWNYCTSSNKGDLQPGMIVAVSTHPHTSAGRTYGHVGIYVGNGTVMDNVGYIRTIGLDSWISYYGVTVTPRWGWAA